MKLPFAEGNSSFGTALLRDTAYDARYLAVLFPGLLEAAHINPYARSSDNSVRNGLLLRSDLHTLFDLGFLLINPDTLKVEIDVRLRGCGYDDFHDAGLFVNGTTGPDRNALQDRWHFFEGATPEK